MNDLPETIRIRVSTEDKRALDAEAKRVGLAPSAWARVQLKRMLAEANGSTDKKGKTK